MLLKTHLSLNNWFKLFINNDFKTVMFSNLYHTSYFTLIKQHKQKAWTKTSMLLASSRYFWNTY